MIISKTVYIQSKGITKTELQLHTIYSANNTIPTDTKLPISCFKKYFKFLKILCI